MRRTQALKPSSLTKIALSQSLIVVTAIGALGLSLFAGSVRDASREARSTIANANGSFVTAVTDTRLQLASVVHEIVSDKSLLQNISWGYPNSVTQSLQNRLRIGELEQLEIFDANCKSVARVHLRASLPVTCTEGSNVGQFSWVRNAVDKTPILALALSFGDVAKSPYKIIGAVNLSEQWLPIHTRLQAQMKSAGLSIATESEIIENSRVLAKEGLDSNGVALARLAVTDNATISWMSRASVTETSRRTQVISILFALGLIVLFWIRQKRHMGTLASAFESFISKTNEDYAENSSTRKAHILSSLTWTPDYSDCIEKIFANKIQLNDEKKAAIRERDEISKLLARKDDELLRIRQRLAELSELNTLGEQLKRTTRAFAEHVHNIRDAFEDLQSILSSGLRHESKQLVALADRWVEGLRDRGSRKFIRSMAETQGAKVESSALDDEIMHLQSTSQAITDLALNASMHAQKLVQSVDHTAEVASLWDKLAHRDPSEESSATWIEVLAGLKRLIKMDTKLAPLTISDYVDEADAASIPKLPVTVWTSTLYHVCLASFDSKWNGTLSTPNLSFRLRNTPTKSFLVISVRLPENTPLMPLSLEQTYHLGVAQALLEPYGIDASPLSVISGAVPIAISWAPSTSMIAANNKKAMEARHLHPPSVDRL